MLKLRSMNSREYDAYYAVSAILDETQHPTEFTDRLVKLLKGYIPLSQSGE